ncbi:glycosyltransferase family 4 protein [Mongoliitalea lutea]|uniref:Uncharacterized protein n=1 Tax=Mongoliitalea lutea TaxID=849756 RepID=A0A8J3CZ31_9BACT|nr:glycosyltransferase family 4 protein [Mongoliitalea lutea]GHB37210.1 hypothetical protein GCM10008106_18130 [Mongoliitalea lutea]
MKITFCAYDKPGSIGGPVTWLQNLLPALKKKGFEVCCLILFHENETGPLFEHLIQHHITCEATKFNYYTEDNVRWILECLKNNPPHIFVPNLVVPAYFAAKWARKAGVFTVGVSHSDDPFYHAIQKEFIDGRKDFRLDGMVCVSNELEKQLNASKFSTNVFIKRIPYGVQIPENKSNRTNNELKVVYVGRLAEEQKRISEVARAFCKMTSLLSNVTAEIYGDGPDRANVEAVLAEEGSGLPIFLKGSVPSDSVQKELLTAHVIVLLSDFEGLPIAILEAMACGVVPVCLRMKSGISEQIHHGETGLVVNDRENDFILGIKMLADDLLLWEKMSFNAKQYTREFFTIEKCHQSWEDYFNSIKVVNPKPLVIPRKINLPKVNTYLARADRRKSFQLKDIYYKLRIKLGKYKRILFKQ